MQSLKLRVFRKRFIFLKIPRKTKKIASLGLVFWKDYSPNIAKREILVWTSLSVKRASWTSPD
jgi:hypothetical protein